MTQATPSVDSPEVLDRFYAHLSLVDILAAQLVRTLRGPVQLDDLVSAGPARSALECVRAAPRSSIPCCGLRISRKRRCADALQSAARRHSRRT